MITLKTLETRWFFPGAVPQGAQNWFASLGTPEIQPPRTDLYLLGVGEGLGVKLREGRVEAKQRTSQHGEINFWEGACGAMEGWVKWSFESEKNPVLALQADPQWVSVEKARQILYYRLRADGRIALSSFDSEPETGGGLELTALRLAGQAWWTVGVEVFGKADKLSGFLREIVVQSLVNSSKISMSCTNSYSYPYWLGKKD